MSRELRRLRRRGLHRDAAGRLAYVESSLAGGLVMGLVGGLLLAIQPIVLSEWSGSAAAYFADFDAVSDWPALIPFAAGPALVVGGLLLLFRRRRLVFDPAAQVLTIDARGLLGRRMQRHAYKDVHAELRRVTLHNPRGFDWRGFELRVLWPGGHMTVCSSGGLRRNTGLERLSAACDRIERETQLHCIRRLDEYW